MPDLGSAPGSGYDLLIGQSPNQLADGDDCEDCCPCECTEEINRQCSATDEDYGTIVNHRSVQVDINLTPSVGATATSRINSACTTTPTPTITCPSGINGTYILDPVYVDAATDVCEGWYYKCVHTELNCHRTFGGNAQTMCMIVWLEIGVRGFYPYSGTLPFNVVNVVLDTCTAWVNDSYLASIDREGFTSADATTDHADLDSVMAAGVQMRSITPLTTFVHFNTVRSWSMRYTGSPFPYKDVWRYVLGGTCRTDCNETVQIGPVDWVDVTEVTSSGTATDNGCEYDDNITAVQI